MSEPEPGRPQSLDHNRDLSDAQAVLEVAAGCCRARQAGATQLGRGCSHKNQIASRSTRPGPPGPLVESKYPRPYPWSPAARKRHSKHGGQRPKGGWLMVIEHLYPRELLVRDLLNSGELDLVHARRLLIERLLAAVITREEDQLLPSRAKVPSTWAEYEADPRLRYREAALPLAEFAPLS